MTTVNVLKSKILGHRGARGAYLENSKKSLLFVQELLQAGQQNIAGIEFDVQLTADNKLFVYHDDDLCRLSGSQSKISQLTLAECQKVTTRKNAIDEAFISLEDMQSYVNGYQHIELEVKTHIRTNHQMLIKALVNSLDCLNSLDKAIDKCSWTITSFDKQFLSNALANKVLQGYKRGLLVEDSDQLNTIINDAQRLQCTQIGVLYQLITPKLINEAHNKGLLVTAWTVNDYNAAKELVEWGVDYIITDYPHEFSDI